MEALPLIEFATNSSTLDSTGVVSFKLVLGVLPAAPIDGLDGMHYIDLAQIFVDRLYQTIYAARKKA